MAERTIPGPVYSGGAAKLAATIVAICAAGAQLDVEDVPRLDKQRKSSSWRTDDET